MDKNPRSLRKCQRSLAVLTGNERLECRPFGDRSGLLSGPFLAKTIFSLVVWLAWNVCESQTVTGEAGMVMMQCILCALRLELSLIDFVSWPRSAEPNLIDIFEATRTDWQTPVRTAEFFGFRRIEIRFENDFRKA